MSRAFAIAAALAALSFPVRGGDEPRLSLPIACKIGVGCQVQNYVDEDAGPGARDFACGGLTYDGHKGTDIRLSNLAAMTAGVEVRAAADGTVKGVRDEMADISIRDEAAPNIRGRECGNGVVLEHGNGWVTQYCHLRRGSVRVKAGDKVVRGGALGLVGLSGDTEFAHLHFEVRNGATVVDPFTGKASGVGACGLSSSGMWEAPAAAQIAYKPAAFLAGGFADRGLDLPSLEREPPAAPGAQSAALVAYVRVLGVRTGDIETLSVMAPDGSAFVSKGPSPLAKSKVQWLSFAGRKRTGAAWPTGLYRARYKLERGGRTVIDETFTARVQ